MNKDIYFLNREWRTWYSLIHFEDHFWIAYLSYFLDPNTCGFLTFVGSVIPDPSGQSAELIVYITSIRVDLYSHQILLDLKDQISVKFNENTNIFIQENSCEDICKLIKLT